MDYALTHLNKFLLEARRLILVEDVVDSLKVGFYRALHWGLGLVLQLTPFRKSVAMPQAN